MRRRPRRPVRATVDVALDDPTSPFAADGAWLRCALHAHTTNSDGDLPPDRLVAHYERAGYDVLASPTTGCAPCARRPSGSSSFPSVELNATIDGTGSDAHVLGLGVEADPVEPGRRFPDLADTVDWIAGNGGVPYLAHPTGAASATRSSPAATGSLGDRGLQRRLRARDRPRPLERPLGRGAREGPRGCSRSRPTTRTCPASTAASRGSGRAAPSARARPCSTALRARPLLQLDGPAPPRHRRRGRARRRGALLAGRERHARLRPRTAGARVNAGRMGYQANGRGPRGGRPTAEIVARRASSAAAPGLVRPCRGRGRARPPGVDEPALARRGLVRPPTPRSRRGRRTPGSRARLRRRRGRRGAAWRCAAAAREVAPAAGGRDRGGRADEPAEQERTRTAAPGRRRPWDDCTSADRDPRRRDARRDRAARGAARSRRRRARARRGPARAARRRTSRPGRRRSAPTRAASRSAATTRRASSSRASSRRTASSSSGPVARGRDRRRRLDRRRRRRPLDGVRPRRRADARARRSSTPAWLDCDVLHLSGYALLREPIADAALLAARLAREHGRARLGRRRRVDGDPRVRAGALPRAARRASRPTSSSRPRPSGRCSAARTSPRRPA